MADRTNRPQLVDYWLLALLAVGIAVLVWVTIGDQIRYVLHNTARVLQIA